MLIDWNNLESVTATTRILAGATAWLTIFAAAAGIGTYVFSNRKDDLADIALRGALAQVREQINNFTARVLVEYSWQPPHNPLLQEDQGGGIGTEDHLLLMRTDPATNVRSETWLRRTTPYTIRPL